MITHLHPYAATRCQRRLASGQHRGDRRLAATGRVRRSGSAQRSRLSRLDLSANASYAPRTIQAASLTSPTRGTLTGAIYRLASLLHGFGARREPSKGSLRG